jgi:hypothetical protein
MLIYVMIYAMLGVNLYANEIRVKIQPSDEELSTPRINFDDVPNAILSVFICLIGDNWNDLMIDVMRSQKSHNSFIYFFQIILIG